MLIRDHRLVVEGAVHDHVSSPNSGGVLANPRATIMHFTAGRSFANACTTLCDPKSNVSAHVVIGRAGEVAQLVPFHKRAWHAGKSAWRFDGDEQVTTSLNAHTVGIELDNAGQLKQRVAGWTTHWGDTVDDKDVVTALDGTGWHAYTEPQLDRAFEVRAALCATYPSIRELLGHSDIAPKRKPDPGAAFPMIDFRARLFARAGQV